MIDTHSGPPARTERYRTSEGKEFVIERRPHRGRRYQEPQPTDDKVTCPYCHQEHDVVCYLVAKGRKAEKKVRTWICPKVGKLPLNQGQRWDGYVQSIIVKKKSETEAASPREAQTVDEVTLPGIQPSSTAKTPSGTSDEVMQPQSYSSRELKSEVSIMLPPQATKSLIEFPVTSLVRPLRTGKVRRNLSTSYSSSFRSYADGSPRSPRSDLDGRIPRITEVCRPRRRRSSRHTVSPKKLFEFRAD